MKIFDAKINYRVSEFLKENLKELFAFEEANEKIYQSFGLLNFFENNEELKSFKISVTNNTNLVKEPDRTEYGDFQTNINLANKSANYLSSKNISPHILLEPTCGKGNFIIASLDQFRDLKKIFGIEIYKPYVWECKFNIINFYLKNPKTNKPDISIVHASIFDFNFRNIAEEYPDKKILIIGNPPWVTNSKLGSLSSDNLPRKVNFKKHNGLDAITGKGNFDIAEYITLRMIETFQKTKGDLALLVKNTVIKNIIYDQKKNKYRISNIEKHRIDSKREFNVSVESSLFYCKLNEQPEFNCKEFNFYNNKELISKFGWLKNKFVSNIDTYAYNKNIDGNCPFIWRQGLKHDCSMVMELEKANGHYLNGLSEEIKLENDLIYGILKSSDLKYGN